MNGVHDMGGMHGMGPIGTRRMSPTFHEAWEGRVYALRASANRRRAVEPRCGSPWDRASAASRIPADVATTSDGSLDAGDQVVSRRRHAGGDREWERRPPARAKATPCWSRRRRSPRWSRPPRFGEARRRASRSTIQVGTARARAKHSSIRAHAIAALRARQERGGRLDRGVFLFPDTNAHLLRRETAASLLGPIRRARNLGGSERRRAI